MFCIGLRYSLQVVGAPSKISCWAKIEKIQSALEKSNPFLRRPGVVLDFFQTNNIVGLLILLETPDYFRQSDSNASSREDKQKTSLVEDTTS
jgi:hypothetical protein